MSGGITKKNRIIDGKKIQEIRLAGISKIPLDFL